jgi:hypothetical protein
MKIAIVIDLFFLIACSSRMSPDDLYGAWSYSYTLRDSSLIIETLILKDDESYIKEIISSDLLRSVNGRFKVSEAVSGPHRELILIPDMIINSSGDTLRARHIFEILKWTADTLIIAGESRTIDSESPDQKITRYERLYVRPRDR